ncbi:MAG: DUF4804 domain-containing protein, partial [Myxococcota bacterium]
MPSMPQTFDELATRSKAVPYTFPEEPCNRLSHVATTPELQAQVARYANQTRPIVHARVWSWMEAFIDHKRHHGSAIERRLYTGMDRVGWVDRLLRCRPLVFMGASDRYLLRDGTRGVGGFEQVGTDTQEEPLLLERVLSYDEMAVSALLGVSVPTRFINSGARANRGVPGEAGAYTETGIYVGLVGARFERQGRMEWSHMYVTPQQNTPAHGYGVLQSQPLLRLWAQLYGLEEGFPCFDEVVKEGVHQQPERFLEVNGGFLDARVYKQRMRMSIEPFVHEAAARAADEGRPAYLHAVGLGLGVWRLDGRQGQLMCDVYADILEEHPELTDHIADLDFSWFPPGCHLAGCGDGDRLMGTRLHFSRRNPAAPLDDDRLLVAMYAWDGNAFPGNEYWLGALTASNNPTTT